MNFKQKVHAVSQVAANIRYIQANTLKIKMEAQDINFQHQERFLEVVDQGRSIKIFQDQSRLTINS